MYLLLFVADCSASVKFKLVKIAVGLYSCLFVNDYHPWVYRDRKGQTGGRNKWIKQQGMRNQKTQAVIKNRDASVTVRPDWVTIEEMDFPRLGKLSLPNVKEGEDM